MATITLITTANIPNNLISELSDVGKALFPEQSSRLQVICTESAHIMFNDDSVKPSFLLYVNAINLNATRQSEKLNIVKQFTECLTNYSGFDQDRGYVLLRDPGTTNWGFSGDLIIVEPDKK
ncbi:11082_t:CDS:2 [Paraglomus occultum]|uniref:11082_t:CDS:1 n=1 Tax=Paraglomus occultum TaxID=144539 RepID=A0A9N9DK21_9GLOM|nr:11082_t:CDS:2 [Paraglomus occultum]